MDVSRQGLKRARALRGRMTPPELRLWAAIRRGALGGLKFRRQHPPGPYVLDFYCPEARLAVEVDGWGHNLGDQPARDVRRDAWLASQGVRTLRFGAEDVRVGLEEVIRTIETAAQEGLAPEDGP